MNGKSLLIDLSHIDRKFIEESEWEMISGDRVFWPGKKLRRKPMLVAALIALMLLLMGCAAVLLMHLDDLRIGQEQYIANMQYREDGSKIPASEKTRNFICTVGAEGSKTQQALMEWMEFREQCNIQMNAEDYEKPDIYMDYPVYSEAMEEKLKDILNRYGLKPTGAAVIFQMQDEALFTETTGVENVVKENSSVETEFGGARVNACGNFNVSYNAFYTRTEDGNSYCFMMNYNYHDKDYFGSTYFTIEDADAVQQWNYTTSHGAEVLIVNEKGEDTHILCDRADAFLDVTVRNVGENWDSPSDVMSRQDMEEIADALNFTLTTAEIPDMDQLTARLEESRINYDNQDLTEFYEARKREYEANECKSSFAELIACMRDNEAYFTGQKNAAYEDFWETAEYTLQDVTDDGENELLLGKNGSIFAIWTMKDGVTHHLEGGYPEGYLCEGNVFEHYTFLDGQPFHFYRQLTNGGYSAMILNIGYHRAVGAWLLEKPDSEPEQISEEEAMKIIDSFIRIEMDMKPICGFPLE